MEFTPEEVLERMEIYERYAHRIKELKDLLLDLDVYGDEDIVAASMQHQDEIIAEIRMIYQDKMVPILEEMARYVSENIHVLDRMSGVSEMEATSKETDEIVDSLDKSRENALDMGSSILSSIIQNMKEPNEK